MPAAFPSKPNVPRPRPVGRHVGPQPGRYFMGHCQRSIRVRGLLGSTGQAGRTWPMPGWHSRRRPGTECGQDLEPGRKHRSLSGLDSSRSNKRHALMPAMWVLFFHAGQAQRRPPSSHPTGTPSRHGLACVGAGLRQRGDLTPWLDEAMLAGWAAAKQCSDRPERSRTGPAAKVSQPAPRAKSGAGCAARSILGASVSAAPNAVANARTPVTPDDLSGLDAAMRQ